MEQISRINHVGLRVRDLAIARAFYEKLGFEFIAGPLGPEPVAIMEHPSGVNINLILNANDAAATTNVLMDVAAKHTGYTHMALQVADAQRAQRDVRALGLTITETVSLPSGAEFFFIRDPDGNVLEFHQPA